MFGAAHPGRQGKKPISVASSRSTMVQLSATTAVMVPFVVDLNVTPLRTPPEVMDAMWCGSAHMSSEEPVCIPPLLYWNEYVAAPLSTPAVTRMPVQNEPVVASYVVSAASEGDFATWTIPVKGPEACRRWLFTMDSSSAAPPGCVKLFDVVRVAYSSHVRPSSRVMRYFAKPGLEVDTLVTVLKKTPLSNTGVRLSYSPVTNPMPCTSGIVILCVPGVAGFARMLSLIEVEVGLSRVMADQGRNSKAEKVKCSMRIGLM